MLALDWHLIQLSRTDRPSVAPFTNDLWRFGEAIAGVKAPCEPAGQDRWVYARLMFNSTPTMLYIGVGVEFIDPPFAKMQGDGMHFSAVRATSFGDFAFVPRICDPLKAILEAELRAAADPFFSANSSAYRIRFRPPTWQSYKVILYLSDCHMVTCIDHLQQATLRFLRSHGVGPNHCQISHIQCHIQVHPKRDQLWHWVAEKRLIRAFYGPDGACGIPPMLLPRLVFNAWLSASGLFRGTRPRRGLSAAAPAAPACPVPPAPVRPAP